MDLVGDDLPIDMLRLKKRSRSALRRDGVHTVGALLTRTPDELMALQNFGVGSLSDVQQALRRHGLTLPHSPVSLETAITRLRFLVESPNTRQQEIETRRQEDLEAKFATLRPLMDSGEFPSSDSQRKIRLAQLGIEIGEFRELRARWVVESISSGRTLEETGRLIGVTRERARQINLKAGGPSPREVARQRTEERGRSEERETAILQARVRNDARLRPGSTLREIAARTGVDASRIRSFLSNSETRFLLPETEDGRSSPEPVWSRDAIISVLREAATYAFPCTANAYVSLLEVGEIDGPTVVTIHHRFGSWIAACEAAGVEPGQSWIEDYQSRWTDDDLYRYVEDYLMSPEATGTFKGFEDLTKLRPGAPSLSLVRIRLGGWIDIKREAIRRLLVSGRLPLADNQPSPDAL